MPDPFNALASFVLGWMKQGLYAKLIRLFSEIFLAGLWSFQLGFGAATLAALANHLSPVTALVTGLGSGQIMSAIFMVATYRADTSNATKGWRIVIPESEAQQELQQDTQTIDRK